MRAISKKNVTGKATDPKSTDGYLLELVGESTKVIQSKALAIQSASRTALNTSEPK